jgi:ribosomal-protein-alanine N-acetyltransferase
MTTLLSLPVSREYPARAINVETDEGPMVFRPMLMSDADQVSAETEASLPELKVWMPWSHAPQTPLTQLTRLRNGEADYFAGRELVMGLFREGAMLAMVGLHPRVELNPRALEVGYWAPTRHTRRGYTTLGVKIAAIYAFDKLACDRLQVSHDEANVASRRVIEKCGFGREGVFRNLTAAPSEELVAGGLRWSGSHPMYALFRDTFEAQPWVADLRARLRYQNILGAPV